MLDHSFSSTGSDGECLTYRASPERNAACGFEIRDDKQPLDNDKGTLHMCIGGLMIALMYSACLL